MKHTFGSVASLKKLDLVSQCLLFILMIFVVATSSLSLFGLYIMAAGQSLSALIWSIYFSVDDCPQHKMGKWIRGIFLLLAASLLLALAVDGEFFFLLSLCMLVLGPVLGLLYFVATIKEAGYYTKARKPYFLL